uniref:EGF-like domain-containing protein n=1 Tax=Rhabditophanes sp. KR3021 TaxID=114890 RepID=A0AC35U8P7_9BILA
MKLVFATLVCVATIANGLGRPKITSDDGTTLIPISNYNEGCLKSGEVYGIHDESLVSCEKWFDGKGGFAEPTYEGYQRDICKKLRVHAEIDKNTSKCVCKPSYYGPMCEHHEHCEKGKVIRKNRCVSICENNGVLAIGTNVECICTGPWQGMFCENLACYRLTESEATGRRFKNGESKKGCVCGPNYKGNNCDEIVMCENNGKLIDGKCRCHFDYEGEICHLKKENKYVLHCLT